MELNKMATESIFTTVAVEYVISTGCSPMSAALRYGIDVTTVRRALKRNGVKPNSVGRPCSKKQIA